MRAGESKGSERPVRRPRQALLALALLSLLAASLVLVAALRLPVVDLHIARYDTGHVKLSHAGRTRLLPSGLPLVLEPAAGPALAIRADALIDAIVARGDTAAKARWWQDRDRIAAAFAAGPVTLRFPDGTRLNAVARPRRLEDLSENFWSALLTGLAALLCGLWIIVMRPRSLTARTFAVMSLGLFGVGCTIAAGYDPLLLGQGYRRLMQLNHGCVHLFAAATLMLFCRFPTPLVPRGLAWAIAAGAAALTLADWLDLTPDGIALLYAAIAGEAALFAALLLAQAWAMRGDPVAGAAMRLIGSSAGLSTALFVGLVIIPMLSVGAPLVSEAVAMPLLLVIYGGLGAAILRSRLVAVAGWAPGLLLSACAGLGAAAGDLAVLSVIGKAEGWAVPAAVVTVGLLYLPLRRTLARRADRRRDAAARHSLRSASALTFARTAEERWARWAETLQALFDPLELVPDPDPATQPTLADHGVTLRLPAVADVPACQLHHARRGARDFDALDREQAAELIEVVAALIGARDAYLRGVEEERSRIARDLHDDVSARLLTSLHRRNRSAMQDDVREAVAEIRTIVAAYTGQRRPLEEVIADLRFETASRLEAHGVALEWPIVPMPGAGRLLDSITTRHLRSIVREMTSNVVRHARASRVAVTIGSAGEHLSIRLADDGVGPAEPCPAGNGLTNSARRAATLGGRFTLRREGGWTVADLAVPLPAAMPEEAAA
jgi:two-component system, NarL family, sensor histidine kinase DevS